MHKHQRYGVKLCLGCGGSLLSVLRLYQGILALLNVTFRCRELRRVDEWLHERAELEGQRYNDRYDPHERCLHIGALSYTSVVVCIQVTLLF